MAMSGNMTREEDFVEQEISFSQAADPITHIKITLRMKKRCYSLAPLWTERRMILILL